MYQKDQEMIGFHTLLHSQPSPISHAFFLMNGNENQKSHYSVTQLKPNKQYLKGGFLRAQTDSETGFIYQETLLCGEKEV